MLLGEDPSDFNAALVSLLNTLPAVSERQHFEISEAYDFLVTKVFGVALHRANSNQTEVLLTRHCHQSQHDKNTTSGLLCNVFKKSESS